MLYAFCDSQDGYYQVEVHDGDAMPEWTSSLTPCQLREPVPVSPPPISCTPWQFRKALNASGLRSTLDAYMATAPQDAKDGYEFATEFRSDDALVISAAQAIGKTPEEAREFIAYASTL